LLNVLTVSGKPKIPANNLGAGGGTSASGVGDTIEDGGDGGGDEDGGDGGVAPFLIGPSEVDGDGTGDDTSFPSELILIS
jgi:hypothetical protein